MTNPNPPRALAALPLALAFLIAGATMAYANGPEKIVAHRGVAGSSQAVLNLPEHAIPTYKWALDHGADIIELDLQVTADKGMVVMHDETINRTTNRTGDVQSRSLSYIKDAWLELPEDVNGNGDPDNTKFHPPSAEQALTFLKPYPNRVTIELKASGWDTTMVGKLKALLVKLSIPTSRVMVHSFSWSAVARAKSAGFTSTGIAVNATDTTPTAARVKAYGNNVAIGLARATPAIVNAYYAAGIRVWLYTKGGLDTYAEYDRAAALPDGKVYAWFVDDLLEVQRYLEAHS